MTGTKPVNFNHTSPQDQFLQSRFIFIISTKRIKLIPCLGINDLKTRNGRNTFYH